MPTLTRKFRNATIYKDPEDPEAFWEAYICNCKTECECWLEAYLPDEFAVTLAELKTLITRRWKSEAGVRSLMKLIGA